MPPRVSIPSDSGVTFEEQHVLHFTGEHATLNRGAHGNRLIRIDILARLFAEQILYDLLHKGHARLATDEDDLGDVARETPASLNAVRHGPTVFCTRSSTSDSSFARVSLMLRCLGPEASAVMYGRLMSVCCVERQLDLRLLRGLLEALHGERVLADIHARLFQELVAQEVDDAEVEVLTTQEGVAVRREHLELALAIDLGDLDDGDVEGAATQVVHRDLAVAAPACPRRRPVRPR